MPRALKQGPSRYRAIFLFILLFIPSLFAQQVRLGDWKAVRKDLLKNPNAPIALYDLSVDIGEKNDIAAKQPDIIRTIIGIIKAEHRPSKEFPIPALEE